MNATPATTATATSAISAAASAAAPNGTPTSPMPVVGLFAKPEDRALFAGHSCAGHASTRHNSPASAPVSTRALSARQKAHQWRIKLIHAAKAGTLNEYPLTKTDLEIKTTGNNTILHIAARYGFINQIDERLCSPRSMRIKNDAGMTPASLIHEARKNWKARAIQLKNAAKFKKLNLFKLTQGDMRLPVNGNEWTVAHVAAKNGSLHQISPHFLTHQLVTVRRGYAPPVYELARAYGTDKHIPEAVRNLLPPIPIPVSDGVPF